MVATQNLVVRSAAQRWADEYGTPFTPEALRREDRWARAYREHQRRESDRWAQRVGLPEQLEHTLAELSAALDRDPVKPTPAQEAKAEARAQRYKAYCRAATPDVWEICAMIDAFEEAGLIRDAAGRVIARSLDSIIAQPGALDPPEAVLPRLAWRGFLTLYSALDKSGKSTLVAAAVAALTNGEPFLGQATKPGCCLWVNVEEHAGQLAMRAVNFKTARRNKLFVVSQRQAIADLHAVAQRMRADVVVIDPLIDWAGDRVTEASRAEQWRPVMDELSKLARAGVAVIVLHHARKSDGETRDSTAITAKADVIIEQKARPSADNVQSFKVRGRWQQDDFAVRLVEGARYELVGGGEAQETSGDRLLALYANGPADGLTDADVGKALKLGARQVRDWRKRLGEQVRKVSGTKARGQRSRYTVVA